MLLRELKEVGFLTELDGTNFETALRAVGANIFKPDASKKKSSKGDSKNSNSTGILQPENADIMIRPVIQSVAESYDVSDSITQSQINRHLTTPELKEKAVEAFKICLERIPYFKVEVIEGLDSNPHIATVLKGFAPSAAIYSKRLPPNPSPDIQARAKSWSVLLTKNGIVDALMSASDAKTFVQGLLTTLNKNIDETISKKAGEAFATRVGGLFEYFDRLETNLKHASALITPDRDVDKADASA